MILSFDDILNKAAQFHADRMAIHEDETGKESSSHDGDDLGSPAHMKTSVDRIRHFGWPKNEMNYPSSGAEANAGPAKGAAAITGTLFAKGWMDSGTHYRPFFAYKLRKIGDHDYGLVGFGVSKTKTGGYYACAVFGVSTKPATRLTDDELSAFPEQILDEINKARGAKGLKALAADEELVKSAQALASKMAEGKRSLKDDEVAESKYNGGHAYSSKYGASIKDVKSALEGNLGGDSPFLDGKMTHLGFAISLDDDGVPYLAFYWGHPS